MEIFELTDWIFHVISSSLSEGTWPRRVRSLVKSQHGATDSGSSHTQHGQAGGSSQGKGAGDGVRRMSASVKWCWLQPFPLQKLNLFNWLPQQTYAESGGQWVKFKPFALSCSPFKTHLLSLSEAGSGWVFVSRRQVAWQPHPCRTWCAPCRSKREDDYESWNIRVPRVLSVLYSNHPSLQMKRLRSR